MTQFILQIQKVGITAKAVEKHLAQLKADDIIDVSDLPKVDGGRLFDFILSACNLLHLQKQLSTIQ